MGTRTALFVPNADAGCRLVPPGGARSQVTWGFLRTGELPHHDQSKVEGIEEVKLPAPGEEDKIYRMDDEFHPRDKGEQP